MFGKHFASMYTGSMANFVALCPFHKEKTPSSGFPEQKFKYPTESKTTSS